MTTLAEPPAAMLMPVGRYEWERLVRRIVMPPQTKLVALLLATWADPDGTRVRPGVELVAAAMGRSPRTASDVVRSLAREWGLIEQVSRGGGRSGRGKTAEYRLVIPTDLLDRHELLGPDGRPDSPATQASSQSPVDNSDWEATQASSQSDRQPPAEPVDNPESPATQASHENDFHRQFSANDRQPCIADYHPRNQATKNQPPPTELPTQPPTARATPNPPHPRTPTRCRHGLNPGHDPTGQPRCPLCRRQPQENP